MMTKFTSVGFFPPIAISVVSHTLGLSPFKNKKKNQIETDCVIVHKNCERTH